MPNPSRGAPAVGIHPHAATGITRVRAALRRRGNWLQLGRFAIVGATGYVVNLSVFAVTATVLGADYRLAAIVAFLVAVTNNLLFNCGWTFRVGVGGAHTYAIRFLTVSLAGLLANLGLLTLLVDVFGLPDVPSQAAAVAMVLPLNFLGNRLWTFRA